MNDFIKFNPFEHVNWDVKRIQALENKNFILTACLMGALGLAGYYIYKYYTKKKTRIRKNILAVLLLNLHEFLFGF